MFRSLPTSVRLKVPFLIANEQRGARCWHGGRVRHDLGRAYAPELELVSPEPFPLTRRPVLRQRWTELAYFHWPYDPAVVQRLLPDGVRVDTYDGAAWVGLIPFEMRDVQLGRTPPLPWLGSFIEINVRTYVIDPAGRRAVWFFSLDVPRAVIVTVARTVFALPYCWSDAHHTRISDRHRYAMTRRWPHSPRPTADIRFTVGDPMDDASVGELEHFVTARWALLTMRRGAASYGRVRHQRWPLHRVHDVSINQDVIEAAGLPAPNGTPHALYSPGVDVEIEWFEGRRSGPNG